MFFLLTQVILPTHVPLKPQLRQTLCTSLQFLLCATLSSLALWPVTTSHLDIPGYQLHLFNSRKLLESEFLLPVAQPGNSSVSWANCRAHLFAFHLSRLTVLCYLTSSVLETIISYFCPFLGCFIWESKSSPWCCIFGECGSSIHFSLSILLLFPFSWQII